jgi:hypothetical protein
MSYNRTPTIRPAGRPGQAQPHSQYEAPHPGRPIVCTARKQHQQLPRLNTSFQNESEESLHLPIQHPSPVKPQTKSLLFNQQHQIQRKPVPALPESSTIPPIPARAIRRVPRVAELRRRSSDALGHFNPRPSAAADLKSSRENLLSTTLVQEFFNPNERARNAAQDKVYGIKMRLEPDYSIQSSVSPLTPASHIGVHQPPAQMPWLRQPVEDPNQRLQDVRKEVTLRRAAAHKSHKAPTQQLYEQQKKAAAPQHAVLSRIRQDRSQLQQTVLHLNGRNELGGYPELLPSSAQGKSVADQFDREFQARQNGLQRPLPPQKLHKPMVEGRSGFVQSTPCQQQPEATKEDFSGWYGQNRRRDRGWKKFKILLAKTLNPRQNRWQKL